MVEFNSILSVEEALIAVERNGYALQHVPDELKTEAVCAKAVESDSDMLRYVFEKSLFIRLAERFEIPINIKDPAVIVKSPQAR